MVLNLRHPPVQPQKKQRICVNIFSTRERKGESMVSNKALPFIGMIMAEIAQVGTFVLSKEAMKLGLSKSVFVLYSNFIAALLLLPLSSLLHRSPRPPLTFPLLCGLFSLALVGCSAQLLGYAGIDFSSATLATIMLNVVPAITFVLAIILRMEKVDWTSTSTFAKTMGTLMSVAGAFIVTLCKGPPILMAAIGKDLPPQLFSEKVNWIFGGLLLTADCVMSSAFIIVQALILEKYPVVLRVVFYYCLFVSIQSSAISLVLERDFSAWSLKPRMRLIAVLYSAVLGSTFHVGVTAWCLNKTGPLFVAMFKPMGIVISVAMGITFFGDTFYLGSLIGAIVIVCGFYSVMWGKAQEKKLEEDDGGVCNLDCTSKKDHLLQADSEEIRRFV